MTGNPSVVSRGASQQRRWDLPVLLCLAVAMFAAPLVLPFAWTNIGVYALMYAIAAIGLSLLMGLAGQVSLGQAAFFAIGGYTQAVLITKYEQPALVCIPASVIAAMLVAALVGLPLLRLRGHFLALGTLGLGIIVSVLTAESDFLGGTSGVFGVPKLAFNGRTYDSPEEYFWLLTPILLLGILIARNIQFSRVGRALSATNDSEVAAESLGVNTFRYRHLIFIVSAGYAALAGVLFVHWQTIINPSAASFTLSVELLLMVVVGGLRSIYGALAGAVAVAVIDEVSRTLVPKLVPGASGEVQLIGFGLVLVLVIMVAPGGIHQLVTSGTRRLHRTRAAAATPADSDGDDRPAGLRAWELPDAGEVLMQVQGLSKRYGGVVALDDVDFEVRSGEVLALIGPNGAGKTTCFNIVSGVDTPTHGQVLVEGRLLTGSHPHHFAEAGVARTFQNLQTFTSTDAMGNVMVGRHRLGSAGVVRGALGLGGRRDIRESQRESGKFLEAVGLQDVAHRPAADLSFGQRRLLEIARALATEPRMLMLDEPLAGLSGGERRRVLALLAAIRDLGVGVLLVEHDMDATFAIADRVAVLDEGRLIAYGEPADVQRDPVVIAAYLGVEAEDLEQVGEEELA